MQTSAYYDHTQIHTCKFRLNILYGKLDKHVYLCLKKEKYCQTPQQPVQMYSRNIPKQRKGCLSTYSTASNRVGRRIRGLPIFIGMLHNGQPVHFAKYCSQALYKKKKFTRSTQNLPLCPCAAEISIKKYKYSNTIETYLNIY